MTRFICISLSKWFRLLEFVEDKERFLKVLLWNETFKIVFSRLISTLFRSSLKLFEVFTDIWLCSSTLIGWLFFSTIIPLKLIVFWQNFVSRLHWSQIWSSAIFTHIHLGDCNLVGWQFMQSNLFKTVWGQVIEVQFCSRIFK